MHLGQGGPDHPSSEGGGGEKAGGDEDGGADEGGEEGAVDGLPSGTWLGKKRPVPRNLRKKNISYEVFVFNITWYFNGNNLVINVGRTNLCISRKADSLNHLLEFLPFLDSSESARHLEKHAEFPYGESFTRAKYSWIISVMITVDSLCSTPKITTSNIHSISVGNNLCQVIKLMIRFREKTKFVYAHIYTRRNILVFKL